MHIIKKLSFISFFSLFFIFSCIEEIDMVTYGHKDRIVINSLFSHDSNFYVMISKSTGINNAVYNVIPSANDTVPLDERWYIDAVEVKTRLLNYGKTEILLSS